MTMEQGRGGGGKVWGPATSKQPELRPDPAGQGRAERQRKYSPVRRESRGTSMVVRGKGEGGRSRKERRAPQDLRENSSVDEGTLSRATPTRQVKGLKTIVVGAVSFAPPPTPKPSTTSRTGRGGVQTCMWDAGEGKQKKTLVGRSRRVGRFLTDGQWGTDDVGNRHWRGLSE